MGITLIKIYVAVLRTFNPKPGTECYRRLAALPPTDYTHLWMLYFGIDSEQFT